MSRGQQAPSQRQLRVGEELRHTIASILERGDIRDPDVAGQPVTVTEVTVSPDLRNATVFVIPLGGGDPVPLLAGLTRVRPYLRHEVAKMVQLRLVPDFSFAADTTFDTASRIEALLLSPEVKRDLADGEDGQFGDDERTVDDHEGQDDGA
ncbi:30S ribosome-binding factor RbfA [Telmatospirillum sp.]|uniref:30S ribosome-binding factor RbfA n=1 Tax=Telmatospirillum sp. TaxID=2079197 RepID=UPI002850D35D|nr:30S ribosome-binding factor RbfA [Telmatospirillum sp.]MDR3440433.1 30S ribosome-binding factor RbfA [Telmatospirillum sp.]